MGYEEKWRIKNVLNLMFIPKRAHMGGYGSTAHYLVFEMGCFSLFGFYHWVYGATLLKFHPYKMDYYQLQPN